MMNPAVLHAIRRNGQRMPSDPDKPKEFFTAPIEEPKKTKKLFSVLLVILFSGITALFTLCKMAGWLPF